MKTNLLLFLFFFCILSCSKKDTGTSGNNSQNLAVLTTTNISALTARSAQCGGNISSDGGSSIITRGVCWSKVPAPTISDAKTSDGNGVGNFTSPITGLTPSTSYYARAYATNSKGTSYGNEVSFATPKETTVPTVTTTIVSYFNSHAAVTGGEVVFDGNSPVTVAGICWSTSTNPTIAGNKTIDASGAGAFVTGLDNLALNTTYYIRAYATNSIGTSYGNELSFTTAYKIGEPFGGGRIFYIDASRLHGLICAETDLSNGIKWDNTTGVWVFCNAFSNTVGWDNTNKIVATLGSSGNAAAICKAYRGGGYSDWYLPANNELYQLYLQNQLTNTNFIAYDYWSSTEVSSSITQARTINMYNGVTSTDFKTNTHPVRPIRAF